MSATQGGVFLPNLPVTFGDDVAVEGSMTVTGDLTVTGTIADTGSSFASPTITGTVAGGATYTAPVLTTPTIGVATATSVNKVVITAPATVATLTIVEGGSLVTAGAFVTTLTSTGTTGVTLPTTGTLATLAGSEGLTNKTITAPVLAGSVTGTYTLAGTPTLTAPTINTPTINGAINTDYKVLAGTATYDNNGTPSAITGFSWTVVPGTYAFDVNLPVIMTTNGGLELSFVLTTAVLTSIQYQTLATTADVAGSGITTKGTTTTSATKVFDSKTAAYTIVQATGSMVVGTGGTFAWFGCQETAASGADSTILALGSYARLTRVA